MLVTAWAGQAKLVQRHATKPSSCEMGPAQDGHLPPTLSKMEKRT
jgi:hypothetical protein